MQLEIITPDGKAFAGEVSMATFPGTDGSFQVLENHAPLIAALQRGPVRYRSAEGERTVTVDGGVVEVLNNRVVVLAEAIVK